jgi:restriction endonuclease S subunit
VLPEYISQYLNSSKGQDDLSEIVSGSYIGAILRKDLENIDIPIPSVQKQKTIVNLFNNIQDQQSISNQENMIKQNIINSIYRKVIIL